MPRVIYFEIGADQPERAIKFYSDVFGWDVKSSSLGFEEYWEVSTGAEGPGINGGLYRREQPEGHVITVQVDSIDDAVAKVEAAGGTVVVPKQALQSIGHMAYCRDTEGTMFGLWAPADGDQGAYREQ